MAEPVIQFKNVYMSFGPKKILDNVSFSVAKGETLAVIGCSGTGKSTILKLMMGLLEPQDGEILIKGQSIIGLNEDEWNDLRKQMGMVFQYSALFDFMNVYENVAFGLRQHTDKGEEEIASIVKQKLQAVGMAGEEENFPVSLSGGMKKRVSLARAIALNPEIILYDEPTAGLDPVMCREISELIYKTKINMGATSILVTHDMASACMASDRIALLNEGHIEAEGTVEEMRNSSHTLVRKFMLGDELLLQQRKEVK